MDPNTGHRVHLHNTALGKAILAHYPRERLEAILDRHGMPQTSEETIIDRGGLFEELAGGPRAGHRLRRRGTP